MKSYSEKFKLELTSKELEVIEEALEMSKAFKVYGDGREKHQKEIDKIIKKLYSEAYN